MGKGTGLGLDMVRRIVDEPPRPGARGVESPGDTRFQVRLPIDALGSRLSVAIVTAAVARDLDDDLPPLVAALDAAGVPHRVVDWDDPGVDWAGFALVVVRSVWDYTRRREELLDWAERVAALAPLANPPGILRWNSDKRYLLDLARAGVPVVPTTIAAPGEPVAWPEGEVVVKPTVSAGSIDTDRYPEARRAEARAHVARLHADGRTAMVQPYLSAVESRGETALVLRGRRVDATRCARGRCSMPGLATVGGLFVEEDIRPAVAGGAERTGGRADARGASTSRAAGRSLSIPILRRTHGGAWSSPTTPREPLLLELELVAHVAVPRPRGRRVGPARLRPGGARAVAWLRRRSTSPDRSASSTCRSPRPVGASSCGSGVTSAIPYGETSTYCETPGRSAIRTAPRWVGRAMARNPIPIIVPLPPGGGIERRAGGLPARAWSASGCCSTWRPGASRSQSGERLTTTSAPGTAPIRAAASPPLAATATIPWLSR